MGHDSGREGFRFVVHEPMSRALEGAELGVWNALRKSLAARRRHSRVRAAPKQQRGRAQTVEQGIEFLLLNGGIRAIVAECTAARTKDVDMAGCEVAAVVLSQQRLEFGITAMLKPLLGPHLDHT